MSQGWQILHQEKLQRAWTETPDAGGSGRAPSLVAVPHLPGGLLEAPMPLPPLPLPHPAQLGQVRAVWLVLAQLSHLYVSLPISEMG